MDFLSRYLSGLGLPAKIGTMFLFAIIMLFMYVMVSAAVFGQVPLDDYMTHYAIQTLLAFFIFFIPALLLAFLYHKYEETTFGYLCQDKLPSALVTGIAVVVLLCSLPFINVLTEANHFIFPEDKFVAARVTAMLTEGDVSHLFLRLLVVAFVPALTEEMFFRGLLQNTLVRYVPAGLAVCATALVFSLAHSDMSAALPRFVLGAFLGWLLVIGKSLWLPILVHFVNNGVAVICYYYTFDKESGVCPIDRLGIDNPIIAVASFVLVAIGICALYKYSYKKTQID